MILQFLSAYSWAAPSPTVHPTVINLGPSSASDESLVYTHPFEIPTNRGNHQPSLSLVYNNPDRINRGYGAGWHIPLTYIELRAGKLVYVDHLSNN